MSTVNDWAFRRRLRNIVIPAHAGIQMGPCGSRRRNNWIPAFAGMTRRECGIGPAIESGLTLEARSESPSSIRRKPILRRNDSRRHRFSSHRQLRKKEKRMLWTIIVILLVLWALGFAIQIGGGLIHLLLLVAGVVLIYQLITGRRVV
jgi:hypothetical protein